MKGRSRRFSNARECYLVDLWPAHGGVGAEPVSVGDRSFPDRVLALDTMYINSIALIVVYGIQVDSKLYFEAAMLIALIGFVSTVAVAKYITRGDIIE